MSPNPINLEGSLLADVGELRQSSAKDRPQLVGCRVVGHWVDGLRDPRAASLALVGGAYAEACRVGGGMRKHAEVSLGGALAGTEPFEKFFSKPYFEGPNGLFPAGNPSIEVGGFAPHLNRWVSRREEADWTPQYRVLRKTSQTWLPSG